MSSSISSRISSRSIGWLGLGCATLLAAGCAGGLASGVPPESDNIGPPVSSYGVPAKAPRGRVHVVSLGRETLPTGTGQPRIYLHLRLAAVNSSDDRLWILDPREQLLGDGADGNRQLAPAFSQSSTLEPAMKLARAERGVLDLYYPMLTSKGKEPARVTLAWRLRRGDQMIAQATDFDRSVERGPGYAYYQAADQAHLATESGSEAWWWSDYYFWHDDNCWWPYRQTDFFRRFPDHRRQWQAERERLHERERGSSDLASRSSGSGESWRGSSSSVRSDFNSDGTSAWRGTPREETVSSTRASVSSASEPSSSSSGGGSSSSSGGGSDGKSSWRGGSGP